MKLISTFFFAFIFNSSLFAQVEAVQLGADFKEETRFGSRQSGFENLQNYSSGTVLGSQFFYPGWANGTITSINNETLSNKYLFLLDKVRQQLFLKWKDSSFILLAAPKQIRSFAIITDKPHYFVPASTYDSSKTNGFYEILVTGGLNFTLLKKVQTTFIKANEHDMEKIKMGENYDAFEDEVTYYISTNHLLPQAIQLKEKSIKKVLITQKYKVADYFKQESESTVDESFLIALLNMLNN